jgi:phage shock protein PspC (stress-responsive transcriptional regulator)
VTTSQTTEQPLPAGPPRARRLERSRDDRVLAGVCGGIAQHFDLDPTLVRVAAIVAIAFGGFGALAYVVAILLIPDEGADRPVISGGPERRRGLALVAAAALGVIVLIALATVGDGPLFGVGAGWPLVLLAAGGALVWFLHERDLPEGPVPTAPPVATPAAPSAASAPASSAASADPAEAPTEVGGEPSEPPTTPLSRAAHAPTPPPRERPSWAVTLFAVGGVLLGLAGAGVLDATDVIDLSWGGFAAITVLLTGVALVASAFFGGARGLIPVGIVLALVLGTTAAAGVSLAGGIGEREHRLTGATQLHDYDLAVGRLALDVRDLALPPGQTRIDADVDVGELEIVAPGAAVAGGHVNRHADGDQESNGLDVDRTVTIEDGVRRLVIDAHVGAGAIVVDERPQG